MVVYGRRGGTGKAAVPVGAVVRDAMLPTLMKLLDRKADPQSWILEHRV